MKNINPIFSSTTLLCLLCSIQQGWSLSVTDDAERIINTVALQQEDPGFPTLSQYKQKPGELNPVTLKFAEPILDGKVVGATIPLAPIAGDAGSYAGYITFQGETLSLDGVTFTGGPGGSYTTVCLFLLEVESDDGEVYYKATNPFEQGMEGSATDAHGIGCTAVSRGRGGGRGSGVVDASLDNADMEEV